MTLKENYLNEISQLKNERIERVVEAAKLEFFENGIKNSKLRVIAKRAKVGEASIYRYFKDKDDLIKIVAFSYWQTHANLFDDYYYGRVVNNDNGLKKIEVSLNIFHHLHKNHKIFLKFVEDFDNYYANEILIPSENSFQEIIYGLKRRFVTMFDGGITDGSINPKFDGDDMFCFISQVMVATTQKLSARIGLVNEVDQEYVTKCIDNLINMFIKYVKK